MPGANIIVAFRLFLGGGQPVSWLYVPRYFSTVTAARQPVVLPEAILAFGSRSLGGPVPLPPSEIDALRDESSPSGVRLIHRPTGREIIPFMHGIIDTRGFRIESRTRVSGLKGRLSAPIFAQKLEAHRAIDNEDHIVPRVRVGNLIITRASWEPAGDRVHSWQRAGAPIAFFREFNRWLNEMNAPELVWLEGLGPLRKRYKPLPVLRSAPHSVEQVWRLLRASPDPPLLRVVEAFPRPDELMCSSERGHHPMEILLGVELIPSDVTRASTGQARGS